ncbi:MAG TPA: SDR family NAD(P)-dependent oxidoreductase [Candidatus Margulisiibacteriota bacterium]|nr:SDR family NAD(P)-dependent oxidoreductase [Candidatus Margulisiibacteriota bacterium]
MLLDGKVALITGAARGIGRATAMQLAAEGAAVGVADIAPEVNDTAAAIQRTGQRAAAAVFDIADPLQVQAGVQQLRERLGDVDILVNDAAIVTNIAPLVRMTHEAWNREVAVNLSGAFNMIKAVIEPMLRKGWGRIINISSVAATGGLHNQAGYAASKAALLGLTQTVTLEYARGGITCNAILPGLIGTELAQMMPPEIKERAIAITPARRLGEMQEVGHLVAFLASDRAGFINGATIHIDGGLRLNVVPVGSRRELAEVTGR